MGLFSKIKQAVGAVDDELMQHGLLGRGVIVGLQPTGTMIASGGEQSRVCDLHIQVFVDGQQPYIAQVRQRVPEWLMGQLASGGVVAVRVSPQDAMVVAVDLSTEAPVVTLGRPAEGQGAAHVLAVGSPAEAVIVSNVPLGLRSFDGGDIHLFTLTVIPPGQNPYQAQVGIPIPPAALPLVYPGARLPVRYVPGPDPNSVTIDWSAAQPTAGSR